MLLEFFDGHTALANKTALTLAGITGPIAFDEEASVVCVDGRPTGELQEWAAVRLVQYVVTTADAEPGTSGSANHSAASTKSH